MFEDISRTLQYKYKYWILFMIFLWKSFFYDFLMIFLWFPWFSYDFYGFLMIFMVFLYKN